MSWPQVQHTIRNMGILIFSPAQAGLTQVNIHSTVQNAQADTLLDNRMTSTQT